MRSSSLILVATLTAVLAGCGKSASQSAAEMAVAAATGGKVQVSKSGDQSQVTIQGDEGTATVNTGTDLALPKDFPSDVHLPASYAIRSAMQIGPTVILTMHSPAAMQSLYSEYDGTMKSGGWTEVVAMQSSQSQAQSVLTFQKDQRTVTVSIVASTDSAGGSDVSLQSTTAQK